MSIKSFWPVLKASFKDFGEDRAMRLSAAMAYYSIFSIGPLLFVMITIAGWVMGEAAVRGQVHELLNGFIGDQSAKTVESMMAAPKQGQNILTTVLGIATLLIGAGGVFGQLQDALNTIWEVQPKPGQGILGFVRTRFLSMAMVLGLGFLLLISMVLTTVAEAVTSQAGQLLPIPDAMTAALSVIMAFVVVTIFFALVYKVLPDAKVHRRDAIAGALFSAVLFTAGKYLLSLYLGKQATSSTYGAAGSIVVVLLWIYYSSIILFLGAEFAQAFARYRGAAVVPSAHAVPITQEARAQQGMPSPEQKENAGLALARKSESMQQRLQLPRPAPRPSFALWLGFGVLASWWFRRHRAGKAEGG